MALLERLVTNATTEWQTGETRYGALLTPQGKIIADFLALRVEDGVWLDVAKDHAADLAKRLKMFRLRSAVEIHVREDLSVYAGLSAGADLPSAMPELVQSCSDPRFPDGRLRLMTADRDLAATGTLPQYHADRIAHAVPEQGTDFGAAEVFPSDINMDLLGGVAFRRTGSGQPDAPTRQDPQANPAAGLAGHAVGSAGRRDQGAATHWNCDQRRSRTRPGHHTCGSARCS